MFTIFRQPSSSFATPLKPIAGIATAALLIGWAAGAGAQATKQPPRSLPCRRPSRTTHRTTRRPRPSVDTPQPAGRAAWLRRTLPPLPLGHDDVREVQHELIALGFDPGGRRPGRSATAAAAQQYDQSRGGSGPVPIDSALLARLKADTAPRLTYDQVAARSQSRSQAQAPASASGAN